MEESESPGTEEPAAQVAAVIDPQFDGADAPMVVVAAVQLPHNQMGKNQLDCIEKVKMKWTHRQSPELWSPTRIPVPCLR
jgi:hypothetical protein